MGKYQLAAASGVKVTAKAKTLVGAKREASDWISFGGGDVYVLQDGVPVCVRRFWQAGNRFGWSNWTAVAA